MGWGGKCQIKFGYGYSCRKLPTHVGAESGPHWDALSLREARSNCHQPPG